MLQLVNFCISTSVGPSGNVAISDMISDLKQNDNGTPLSVYKFNHKYFADMYKRITMQCKYHDYHLSLHG